MESVFQYLKLIRITIGTIVVLALLCAANIAKFSHLWQLMLACISLFCLTSGGFAINDYFDVEKDKINSPHRPIPSGLISRKSALFVAVLLFIAGVGVSVLINLSAFFLSIAITLLLVFYSRFLKTITFIGNIVTAFLSSTVFIYGGLIGKDFNEVLLPSIFTFLLILGREIIMDIKDVEGDKHMNMGTLPIVLGEKKSLYIAFIPLSLLMVLNPIPYFLGVYNQIYFCSVSLIMNAVLLTLMMLLSRSLSKKNIIMTVTITRILFIVGIIGIWTGQS